MTSPDTIGDPPTVLLSIVVAVKNDQANLRDLFNHTRAADLGAVEIVIIDGDSKDGTSEWLMSLDCREAPSIRWASAADNGIAQAWNHGVALARGDWLIFLGADDRIYDLNAWRTAMRLLLNLPPLCGLAIAPVAVVAPSGQLLAIESPPPGSVANRCFYNDTLSHQGVFHRRLLWSAYGPFDTALKIAADYEFCLRAVRSGAMCERLIIDPPVAMTFGGMSKRNPLSTLREIRHVQRKYDIRLPLVVRASQWLRAWLKWCGLRCMPPSAAAWCADVFRKARGLPPVWTVP